ncbi:MAG TPA: EAL domain-containing protein [Sphingomonadaceae bacterium]|nr:EAL domain-containing protein [Sphingomonadaceae bacterium]
MLHAPLSVPPYDLAAAHAAPQGGSSLRARFGRAATAADARDEALSHGAPLLAAIGLGCTALVAWTLIGEIRLPWLAGWAALVLLIELVLLRRRRRAASYGRRRGLLWPSLGSGLHAVCWASLPALALPGQPPATQFVLGGAMSAMMAGAFLLALAPAAATARAAILAGALIWALRVAEGAVSGPMAALLLYLGGILGGCFVVERLLSRQIERAEEERARREATGLLLKEYEEQGAGWLWQIDAQYMFTYVSPRISLLLGRPTSQLLGQSFPVVLGGLPRLEAALAARNAFSGLEVLVQTAGGARFISLAGNPILGADGEFQGFRGVGSDITEVRRSQERLTHMASIDVLTGLPNRQRMRELFTTMIAACERTDSHCAILFLDLDGFKPVNDTFGHPIGDAVLRTVARRLANEVGDAGVVGRIGGDEFAIALGSGPSRRAVEELGQRLIDAIAVPYPFEGTEIRIGLSIGSAFAPIDGTSVNELLLKADLALYQAKSQGRGTFLHFDAKMQRDVEERARLEQDLRQALARNQLKVLYQPIVSARTQAVVGFEALLRWEHHSRGLVPPTEFVPIAEETGLIAEIGEWVLKTACEDAAQWPDHIAVSVNLSPRQLIIPALPNAVSEALASSRIQPSRLELEVTESVFMSDSDGSLDVLRRVRSLGVGVSLDDFGTGYSSLGYLNKTIFHTLKIDGSFVRDAATKSETVSIIRAIVALANSFRMTITAEGVETPADFERMQALGCHKIQGYLFGRPVPFAETLPLVGVRWDFGARRAG